MASGSAQDGSAPDGAPPRTNNGAGGASGLPPAPVPRRMQRPRWLDPRVVIGLLLVIASVVIGAKVIGSSKQTTGVWAATHDLAAGTVLAPEDVTRIEVNLAESAGGYLDAGQSIDGRVLINPVSNGNLVPVGALTEPAVGGRLVAVGVEAGNMPPGVRHSSVIDVYMLPGSGSGSGGKSQATELIARQVVVQSVQAPSSGGLSGAASSKYQVVLLLPAEQADELVRQLPQGEPFIVLIAGAPK